jgi:hypothetical protein
MYQNKVMPAVSRRKGLMASAVLVTVAIATAVWLLPTTLGSSKWETIEPKHLAMLPDLSLIRPLIRIDRAIAYGFLDKIYRFRFKPDAGSTLLEFAHRLQRDGAYVAAIENAAALAQQLRVVEGVPSAPDWWSDLRRQDTQRASLLFSSSAHRDVVLILLHDHCYGQITER